MPIETVKSVKRGWIEFDVTFLASMFGLKPTGEVKVILGKVHIGVEDGRVPADGAVLEGLVTHTIIPTGVRPKVVTH